MPIGTKFINKRMFHTTPPEENFNKIQPTTTNSKTYAFKKQRSSLKQGMIFVF